MKRLNVIVWLAAGVVFGWFISRMDQFAKQRAASMSPEIAISSEES